MGFSSATVMNEGKIATFAGKQIDVKPSHAILQSTQRTIPSSGF